MTRDVLDLGSWVILRMASADTLRAARSLTQAGLRVWTPIERRVVRIRMDRSRIYKEAALMPSYVFGRVEHLSELLHLAHLQRREHPKFSVFRFQGGIPLIADQHLGALRDEEARLTDVFDRAKRKGVKAPVFEKDTEVKLTEGAFAGLSGIVEGHMGQYTLVSLEGFHEPIKVASILLLPENADECAKAA